jgi:hypothetical protein
MPHALKMYLFLTDVMIKMGGHIPEWIFFKVHLLRKKNFPYLKVKETLS